MAKKEVSGSDLSARYSDQFKCDVVTDLLNTGDDISVVARRHGIGLSTLYTWLSTFGLKTPKQEVSMLMEKDKDALIRELAEVKRENSKLKVERFRAEADALVHKTLLEYIEKKYHIEVKKKTDSKL